MSELDTEVRRNDGPSFEPVAFEPKPVQSPLPVFIGGESEAALRRAGRLGDGWLGMEHTPDTAAAQVARLRKFAEEAGRDPAVVEATVMGTVESEADVDAYAAAGVDRLIFVPWRRSREAVPV